MADLTWEKDPDPVDDLDQIGFAGHVPVGHVKRSGSGRWRWEIVALPGDNGFRDKRRGWCEGEGAAKAIVAIRWGNWLLAAGLAPRPVPDKEK